MIIEWDKAERDMLAKMELSVDVDGDLSEAQLNELYDVVPNWMLDNTDTTDDRRDSPFNICEDIITKLWRAISA